ncbi:MAG TPA: response regulator [Bacteroidia bacterium]|nr:response regulator [Bacteroidia bacterium]HNP99530.1 response regulator [Bacteroidia bacterium]
MHSFRIVVIEDNQQIAEMTKDFLEMNFPEAETVVYATGEEAIQKTTVSPDVFIVDYNLDSVDPKALNGIQIMMKMKERHKTPVIFLTAQENATMAANIIKHGAYDYVAKSNQDSFTRLKISINNVLEKSKLEKEAVKHRKFIGILAVALVALVVGIILLKVMV